MKNKFLSNLSLKAQIIVFIIILAFVNLIGQEVYFRFDLTENKKFTLSAPTKEIVSNLDDIIVVKTYFSEKLPINFKNNIDYVKDILHEFENVAKGNFSIKQQDVTKEDIKREALMDGIPELGVTIKEKDELKAQNVFLGMSLSYHGKKEIFPALTYEEVSNLEYNLITAIYKLTQKEAEKKKIGLVKVHSSFGENDLETIKKEIGKMYEIVEINLDQKSDVNTLIILGPNESFTLKEKFFLEQEILKGKSVLIFADRIADITKNDANMNSLQPIETGLEEILENLGITLEKELVADVSMDRLSYSQGFMRVTTNYPLFPLITKNTGGFSNENVITASLNQVSLKWPSHINFQEKENLKSEVLLSSTSRASLKRSPYDINPEASGAFFGRNESDTGKYNFAVLTQGKLKSSLYAKNEEATKDLEIEEAEILVESKIDTKFLIVANAHFLRANSLNPEGDEMKFFLNAVDFLTMDEKLISIRAKSDFIRPLDKKINEEGKIPENIKTTIRVINLGLIPLIVVMIGLFIYFRRKK